MINCPPEHDAILVKMFLATRKQPVQGMEAARVCSMFWKLLRVHTLVCVCRFPQPLLPSLAELPRILADSLPMALVTFAVSASLASIYADKYSYTIDSNQV